MARPLVFIGSSAEGLKYAQAIQANLDHDAETIIWSQGVFGIGENSISPLVALIEKLDFAILVVTPDDLVASRGDSRPAPRDNVVLELGLFIGGLGIERTFMVVDRSAKPKLPSDLAGITPATFVPPVAGTVQACVGAACTAILEEISRVGQRYSREASESAKGLNVRTRGESVTMIGGCGIGLVVRNTGIESIPPFDVKVQHDKGAILFERDRTGFLLPEQERTFKCRLYDDEIGFLHSDYGSSGRCSDISKASVEMQFVLEDSSKVLYTNKRVGRAIISLLRIAAGLTNGLRLGGHEPPWFGMDNNRSDN